MISVDAIGVDFNGKTLFNDVSFVVNPADKIALMGKNGAGKSTIMKIIAGIAKSNRGTVRSPDDTVIAYLPQHLLTEDNCTVFEETSKAFGCGGTLDLSQIRGDGRCHEGSSPFGWDFPGNAATIVAAACETGRCLPLVIWRRRALVCSHPTAEMAGGGAC